MNRREFVKLGPAFPAAAVTATLTLKEDGKPPIEGLDVSVLKWQPGDTLIIQCSAHLSMETAERIKRHVEGVLPGATVMVFDAGLTLEGVLRGPA